MLRLVWGTVEGNTFAPNNRRSILQMIRFINQIVRFGRDAIKEMAHKVRSKYVGGPLVRGLKNRGTDDKSLFVASSVARGLSWPETDDEVIKNEVESALDRLENPSPLPSKEVLDDISRFIEKITKHAKSLKHDRSLKMPGPAACLEQPRRRGGIGHFLYYGATSQFDQVRFIKLMEKEEKKNPDAHRKGIFATHKEVMINKMSRMRPPQLGEMFDLSLDLAKFENRFKPLPVLTQDGKVRVATIHNGRVVWAAQNLTKFFMPYLKKLSFTSPILRNRTVVLTPCGKDPILYSADLSKSTDPISIELSKFVLGELASRIGKPEWYDRAVEAVFKPFVYEKDGVRRTSNCGALMGLGPGWIVLNLINAYAAYKAGASPKSLSICGDDLIGYWSQRICDKYEANLISLGLVPNKKKSFRGKNGVFCERPVLQKGEIAIAKYCVRMAEVLTPAKSQADHLDRIKDLHPLLRHEARKSATRHHIRRGIPGRFQDGGTGGGRANAATLVSYIRRGAIPLRSLASKTSSLERDLLAHRGEAGVVLRDVLQIARRELRRKHLASGGSVLPNREFNNKTIALIDAKRQQLIRPHLRKGFIKGLKDWRQRGQCDRLAGLSDSEFRHLCHHVRHKRYELAIGVVRRVSEAKVPHEAVKLCLERHDLGDYELPVQLDLRPKPRVWDSDPQ
jgi:hypothetical protein